jgi:hypothetical protein
MSMVQGSGLPLETLAEDIKKRVNLGDRDAKRSEDHYKAAGLHLIEAQARVRAELPGTPWLTWVATNLSDIKERRVQQLMQIARGDTTQADLNAASNRHRSGVSDEVVRSAEDFIRRHEQAEADARKNASDKSDDQAAAHARDAERQRRNRAERRTARVAAGADLPPPLAPIEHRRLLKEGRDLLGAMSFDDLKVAVETIKVAVAEGESEADIKVANALYLSGLISDAEIAWRAKWKTNGVGLLEVIKSALDAMPDDSLVAFAWLLDAYMVGRGLELVEQPEPEVVADPEPAPGTPAAAQIAEASAVKEDKAVVAQRLKLLRERAEKNGYRLVRRGSDYRLTDKDSGSWSGHADLDEVESKLDASEGKVARQLYTPCGMVISGWNNSEEWLAAHPGKTMEDFERALPPVESTCAVEAEPSPEVVADPEPEPELQAEPLSDHARKMALADSEAVGDTLTDGRPMAQESAAATVIRKGSKKHGPVIRPDVAAIAAERGLPVSPRAAA